MRHLTNVLILSLTKVSENSDKKEKLSENLNNIELI